MKRSVFSGSWRDRQAVDSDPISRRLRDEATRVMVDPPADLAERTMSIICERQARTIALQQDDTAECRERFHHGRPLLATLAAAAALMVTAIVLFQLPAERGSRHAGLGDTGATILLHPLAGNLGGNLGRNLGRGEAAAPFSLGAIEAAFESPLRRELSLLGEDARRATDFLVTQISWRSPQGRAPAAELDAPDDSVIQSSSL